jgi:hypothetical protein
LLQCCCLLGLGLGLGHRLQLCPLQPHDARLILCLLRLLNRASSFVSFGCSDCLKRDCRWPLVQPPLPKSSTPGALKSPPPQAECICQGSMYGQKHGAARYVHRCRAMHASVTVGKRCQLLACSSWRAWNRSSFSSLASATFCTSCTVHVDSHEMLSRITRDAKMPH